MAEAGVFEIEPAQMALRVKGRIARPAIAFGEAGGWLEEQGRESVGGQGAIGAVQLRGKAGGAVEQVIAGQAAQALRRQVAGEVGLAGGAVQMEKRRDGPLGQIGSFAGGQGVDQPVQTALTGVFLKGQRAVLAQKAGGCGRSGARGRQGYAPRARRRGNVRGG